jgi:tripeptide aminopeptidase
MWNLKLSQIMTANIVLNMEQNIILSWLFQELSQYKGQTLITTDGTTLGADDKAGITEIVTAMEF